MVYSSLNRVLYRAMWYLLSVIFVPCLMSAEVIHESRIKVWCFQCSAVMQASRVIVCAFVECWDSRCESRIVFSWFSFCEAIHVIQCCAVFMGGEVIHMRQSIATCVLCGVTHVRHCFIWNLSNNNWNNYNNAIRIILVNVYWKNSRCNQNYPEYFDYSYGISGSQMTR